MNKFFRIFSIGLVLVVAAACATVPTLTSTVEVPLAIVTPTSAPVVVPTVAVQTPDPVFFARPQGNHGPAMAYSLENGALLFTLPAGLFSADKQHYFVVDKQGGLPVLNSYDPATGQLLRSDPLQGEWVLNFVTADGGYVALSQQASDKQQLTTLIMDGKSGQEKQRVTLDGNLDVDGLSADGASLYIIEYLPAKNPDHYQVRAYDTASKQLLPDALFDKREPDEVMEGQRWDSVNSNGGQWLLSLYARMKEDEAFVHALNTTDRYAFCIDLPAGGGDLTQQKFNTLALSPQGLVLYVANAVTGTVSEANLGDFTVSQVTNFAGQGTPADPDAQIARSLMSADGRKLYFTSGEDVWVYDTVSRSVSGPFASNGSISGLGLNSKGDRLLVAKMDGSLVALDTTSGVAVSLR